MPKDEPVLTNPTQVPRFFWNRSENKNCSRGHAKKEQTTNTELGQPIIDRPYAARAIPFDRRRGIYPSTRFRGSPQE